MWFFCLFVLLPFSNFFKCSKARRINSVFTVENSWPKVLGGGGRSWLWSKLTPDGAPISVLLKNTYCGLIREQLYKVAKIDFRIIHYVSWFIFKIRLIFETSGF